MQLQPTDITNNGGFYPSVLEDAFDRAVILIQQLQELLGRQIVAPVTDVAPVVQLPTASQRALKPLIFDAAGNATVGQQAYQEPQTLLDEAKAAAETIAAGVAPGSGSGAFIANGTGAVTRTFQSKMRDVVSVKDFGATGDGVTDDSAAIQAALNSGALSIYFPAGRYLAVNLIIPQTMYLVLHGDGMASVLVQKAGGKLLSFPPTTTDNFYLQGLIKSLAFDGTNGTASIIDTSYAGGLTFKEIYINNVPVGHDGIYINGMPTVYTHDVRIDGLQVYTRTVGRAGLAFGPTASDSDVTAFIMNGNFATQYCMVLEAGAQTITLANSHPYNAAVNVLQMQGNNSQCSFNAVTLDNARSDIVSIVSGSNNLFVNCYMEAIPAGAHGVALTGCKVTQFQNCRFDGAVGAAAAIAEDSNCNDTIVVSGALGTIANYVQPFLFYGNHSYATGIAAYNPLNMKFSFSGTTQVAQAQNTTQYLGVNGAQATASNTAFVVPVDAVLANVFIACDSQPATGQTFTFSVVDGVTVLGTLTLSHGQFSGTIALNKAVSSHDQISITSVFSATSGSSNVRYVASFTA
ncbi:MAG: glycosyl hydrolase family 28-related protein [Acidobacteriaceae bacterium]|nr:glycosyl hydrolase family 28-related protein [Acidobacteriaceae bacterium]